MNMHHTVDTLQSLPAMPKTAQEILSIELATDKGDELLLRLIEKDLAIAARVIGLANSPLFGTSRKIMTVGDAATVLGIKRVKMIALGFAMMSSVTRNPPGLLNVKQLWQHSMAVAMAMEALSRAMPRALRPPDEEIYLAGLLHDIGFLVLEFIEPELSNQFHLRMTESGGSHDNELEAEMLEMNHCELGALLSERWNLNGAITAVLRQHHLDGVPSDAPGQPLIAMTNLAEKLLPTFVLHGMEVSSIAPAEWQALGISDDQVAEVEAAMRQRAEEIAAAFA